MKAFLKRIHSSCHTIKILSVLLVLFSTACNQKIQNKNQIYFSGIEWYYNDELVLRNDSAISFTQFDTEKQLFYNDSAFPIYVTDSTLIYTRYRRQGNYNENKDFVITSCEKVIDTVKFDFKYINKQPKLILYLEPFPLILSTNEDLNLPETHYFKPVKFVISEYSIGDQIDRSLLKTRGIYNYSNYTIEDCELIDNKDITITIIGYNTVYSIERRRIEDYRLDEIKKVVTAKLELDPVYKPMRQWIEDANYEYEFYRWEKDGVQVNLSRSKYIGTQSYKSLVTNSDWILTYDDAFLQAILIETYRNGKPQSSIIN